MYNVMPYLFCVKVDKTVPPGLALQRPWLVEQEIKLFHFAKLLQKLHQVVSARTQQPLIRQDRAVRLKS